MKAYAIVAGLLCLVFQTLAQKPDTTENYIRINYDNDIFTFTDRYYTQGLSILYIHSFLQRSPFSKILISLGPKARNYYGIGITQRLYTPTDITRDTILSGDRPYAGTLYLTNFLLSIDNARKMRLATWADLGVIGPAALGGQGQKLAHRVFSSTNEQPEGWDLQIANDAIVNYNVRFEKGLINTRYFELIGSTTVRLGTLNDDLSVGLMVRTGLMNGYFSTYNLYRNTTKRNAFQIYLYGRGDVSAIAYNATLQGGVFNRSSVYTIPAGDVKRIVGSAAAGIVVSYKRVGLEFGNVITTPQFKGGLYNAWGHCAVFIAF